jgi:hypothetical protein
MVKVGDLFNYALWGTAGYIVYKNWTPLKKLFTSVTTGASSIIGGGVGLLESAGNKLADVFKKDETPQQQAQKVFEKSFSDCEKLGWTTSEEKAKCVNLDYVQRGIKNNKLVDTLKKEDTAKNTPAPAPVKSGGSSSSSNKLVDELKSRTVTHSVSKVGNTTVKVQTVKAPTDSLSGKDKGKGSYIVKKADGSRVTRYFQ